MSDWDALVVLRSNLEFEGFPDLQIGVPESALRGPFPAWYVDLPDEDYEYGALQPVYRTSAIARAPLFVIAHVSNKPVAEESLGRWLKKTVVPNIVLQVETLNLNGKFAADGATGSAVHISNVRFDFSPDNLVAAVRLLLEIRAYQ